jgi:holliday junction DNA helicase RuvA
LGVIAQLTGWVVRTAPFLVLDVNGVGYKIFVPITVLEALPPEGSSEKVTLQITMIVREDDMSLYGFLDISQREVFEQLLTVSGVGPKAGLALLSKLTAEELAGAVATEDVRTLTKVPGIGLKTAQRMVLELREKLKTLGFNTNVGRLAATDGVQKRNTNIALIEDVSSALQNLGYTKMDANKAAEAALEEKLKTTSTPVFAEVLRSALNRLTGVK